MVDCPVPDFVGVPDGAYGELGDGAGEVVAVPELGEALFADAEDFGGFGLRRDFDRGFGDAGAARHGRLAKHKAPRRSKSGRGAESHFAGFGVLDPSPARRFCLERVWVG